MPHKKRIEGFDVARAFAVFGMVFVNFKIVVGANSGTNLYYCISFLEGRASAVFVVLAGVGLSLMSASSSVNSRIDSGSASIVSGINSIRVNIIKRAVLLIFLGLLFSLVWPADILHFYGVYFLFAAVFIYAKNRTLVLVAVLSMCIFVVLLFTFDYEQGWNFSDLSYLDFWTVEGMLRHVFFNGFHPVFPWITFVIVGMILGRMDLAHSRLRRKILFTALAVWVLIELSSKAVLSFAADIEGLDPEYLSILSTAMMPPMPQYIVAAASLAVAFICLCVEISQIFSVNKLVKGIGSTGQLALTLYAAHVVVGMGIMQAVGILDSQSIYASVFCALAFNVCSIVFAHYWLRNFSQGPLEWCFRKLERL
ncbi:MAG: hypothetical protein ACI93R_001413 [Flavobacteriales bacterium]|jgi:uncharacterized protein